MAPYLDRRSRYLRRKVMNALLLVLADVLALLLVLTVVVGGTRLLHGNINVERWMPVFVVLTVLTLALSKMYPGWGMGLLQEVRRLSYALTLAGALALLLQLTEFRGFLQLGMLIVTVVGAWFALILSHFLVRKGLIARGTGGAVAIYGGAETGRTVIEALRAEQGYGFIPTVVFDDAPDLVNGTVLGLPVVGALNADRSGIPVAIVAMPGLPTARLRTLLAGPLRQYRHVVIVPDLFNIPSLWAQSRDLNGVLGLEISQNLRDPVSRALKLGTELLLVLLSLPFWGPLCLLIGVLIWLEDRANPLFLQPRIGKDGRIFNTWKFRTMLPNAEDVLKRRLAEDPALRAEWEANFKLRVDPRITRVGAFLRKTSLDELPQLVNVLRREMSLIGPRPLPAYHQEQLPREVQDLRASVRPGMTGLWQVSGRSDSGNIGMERWDPYYVQNWSVWLDIVVLLKTVRVVVYGSGAY